MKDYCSIKMGCFQKVKVEGNPCFEAESVTTKNPVFRHKSDLFELYQ